RAAIEHESGLSQPVLARVPDLRNWGAIRALLQVRHHQTVPSSFNTELASWVAKCRSCQGENHNGYQNTGLRFCTDGVVARSIQDIRKNYTHARPREPRTSSSWADGLSDRISSQRGVSYGTSLLWGGNPGI